MEISCPRCQDILSSQFLKKVAPPSHGHVTVCTDGNTSYSRAADSLRLQHVSFLAVAHNRNEFHRGSDGAGLPEAGTQAIDANWRSLQRYCAKVPGGSLNCRTSWLNVCVFSWVLRHNVSQRTVD